MTPTLAISHLDRNEVGDDRRAFGSAGIGRCRRPRPYTPSRLRERLEIRELADGLYHAHAGEQFQLQALADVHDEDAVLDWLRFGLPTPRLDVATLSDLLAAGVTAQRYGWLVSDL